MKPHISVIAPVRGRIAMLDNMLESLIRLAAHPEQVEVVLRADHDDADMVDYLRRRDHLFIVGPRRDGYITLPSLINDAARLSRADLVIVVNDDVEFMTPGWDAKLVDAAALYPDGIFNLGVDTVLNNANFVFPCVHRRTMEVLGCFYDERIVYTDIWLRDVMEPFGRAIRVDNVVIRHNWTGMTRDQQRALGVVHGLGYQDLYARCVEEGREKVRQVLVMS